MMPPLRSKSDTERRRKAHRGGHRAEAFAALWLQAKLYTIRDRRYKTPVGEIDLVAERAGTIVFVEVKQRGRGGDEATALEAVNQARISRAANYWLMRHPAETGKDCRFDVIFLAPGRWPRHLRHAFPAV
jgi:putative endonuclease